MVPDTRQTVALRRLNTGDYRYVPISYPADKNRRSRVCTLHLHRENKFHVNSRRTGLWDVSAQPAPCRTLRDALCLAITCPLGSGNGAWHASDSCTENLETSTRMSKAHTEAERLMTYGVRAWTGINPLSVYTGKALTIREDTLHPQNDVFRSSSIISRSDTSDNITHIRIN